jgi:hypothetical protein
VTVTASELAPPAPSPASECVPPPGTKGGGGQHSLAVEGAGGGGEPVRMTGEKAWHSVFFVGVAMSLPYVIAIKGEVELDPIKTTGKSLFQCIL